MNLICQTPRKTELHATLSKYGDFAILVVFLFSPCPALSYCTKATRG